MWHKILIMITNILLVVLGFVLGYVTNKYIIPLFKKEEVIVENKVNEVKYEAVKKVDEVKSKVVVIADEAQKEIEKL